MNINVEELKTEKAGLIIKLNQSGGSDRECIVRISAINQLLNKVEKKIKKQENIPELIQKLGFQSVPTRNDINYELESLEEDVEICQDLGAIRRMKLLQKLYSLVDC